MSGRKNDAEKPIAGTVLQDFGNALTAVSIVGTFGARKYSKSNWLKVERGIERYTDAMARHFLSEPYEAYDPDSNICHAAHTAWNALARLELMLRGGINITDMGETYVNINFNSSGKVENCEFKESEIGRRQGTDSGRQVSATMHDAHKQCDGDSEEAINANHSG